MTWDQRSNMDFCLREFQRAKPNGYPGFFLPYIHYFVIILIQHILIVIDCPRSTPNPWQNPFLGQLFYSGSHSISWRTKLQIKAKNVWEKTLASIYWGKKNCMFGLGHTLMWYCTSKFPKICKNRFGSTWSSNYMDVVLWVLWWGWLVLYPPCLPEHQVVLSDEHEYLNIWIKWPQILFVFVFVPFPQYKNIRIFVCRFLDDSIHLDICL